MGGGSFEWNNAEKEAARNRDAYAQREQQIELLREVKAGRRPKSRRWWMFWRRHEAEGAADSHG